jgi:hypothetical protein
MLTHTGLVSNAKARFVESNLKNRNLAELVRVQF